MSIECGVCGKPVKDTRQRRAIFGDTECARDCVSILADYTTEHFPGCNIRPHLEALPPNRAYIGNTCQQRTNTYARLKAQLDRVSEEIAADLRVLLGSQPQPSGSSTGSVQATPSRMRATKESPAVKVSL
jgi:hypothetical protein